VIPNAGLGVVDFQADRCLLLNTLNWSFFMILAPLRRPRPAPASSAELRQSELARALQLAELRLLKSSRPHFLFNAPHGAFIDH
jgi:hypothetical protein